MRRYVWIALVMVAACDKMCEPTMTHVVACTAACQPNGVRRVTFLECDCKPSPASGEAPAAPKGDSP